MPFNRTSFTFFSFISDTYDIGKYIFHSFEKKFVLLLPLIQYWIYAGVALFCCEDLHMRLFCWTWIKNRIWHLGFISAVLRAYSTIKLLSSLIASQSTPTHTHYMWYVDVVHTLNTHSSSKQAQKREKWKFHVDMQSIFLPSIEFVCVGWLWLWEERKGRCRREIYWFFVFAGNY